MSDQLSSLYVPNFSAPAGCVRAVVPAHGQMTIVDWLGNELPTQQEPCLIGKSAEVMAVANSEQIARGLRVMDGPPPDEPFVMADAVHAVVGVLAEGLELVLSPRSTDDDAPAPAPQIARIRADAEDVTPGAVRVREEGHAKLGRLDVWHRFTVYRHLPIIELEIELGNGDTDTPGVDVALESIKLKGLPGFRAVSTCERPMATFVPWDDWSASNGKTADSVDAHSKLGRGSFEIVPLGVLHTATVWSCSIIFVPDWLADHPSVEAWIEQPGRAQAFTFGLDGKEYLAAPMLHGFSLPSPSDWSGGPQVIGQMRQFLEERGRGLPHGGSFPAGTSFDSGWAGEIEGASARRKIRHGGGQKNGGGTGGGGIEHDGEAATRMAARADLAFCFRKALSASLYDRQRGLPLTKGGAGELLQAFDTIGGSLLLPGFNLVLGMDAPGNVIARKTEDPHSIGIFTRSDDVDADWPFGNIDPQHIIRLLVADAANAQENNCPDSKRRIKVLAATLRLESPSPSAFLGRGDAWPAVVYALDFSLNATPESRVACELFVAKCTERQRPNGGIMENWSKEATFYAREFAIDQAMPGAREAAGYSSMSGQERKEWLDARLGVQAIGQTYQEAILLWALFMCDRSGIHVPHEVMARLCTFIAKDCREPGAASPWYRVFMDGSRASVDSSSYHYPIVLAIALELGVEGADSWLRDFTLLADPLTYLFVNSADKMRNRWPVVGWLTQNAVPLPSIHA